MGWLAPPGFEGRNPPFSVLGDTFLPLSTDDSMALDMRMRVAMDV